MSIHIMNAVWQHGPQGTSARMLLLAIADCANDQGDAFPSVEFARHARPLRMDGYYLDSHGSLRRITPKRDRSISARQWRKQRRARREVSA